MIFQCILRLQIQSIDFTNAFSQTGITSGEPTSIEFTRDFESDGVQCDVVIRLKAYLVKTNHHASVMKTCRIFCYIAVLW